MKLNYYEIANRVHELTQEKTVYKEVDKNKKKANIIRVGSGLIVTNFYADYYKGRNEKAIAIAIADEYKKKVAERQKRFDNYFSLFCKVIIKVIEVAIELLPLLLKNIK